MPELRLIRRDPNKGYIGRNLWLPKAHINVRSVKRGLEFPINGEEGIEYLQLWRSDQDHLVVPRAFFPPETYEDMDFPVISSAPASFPKIRIESNIILDKKDPSKTTQRDAFAAMLRSNGGLLNLACGKGKTCLALHYIAHKGMPAIVIVNNTTLIDQWAERIEQHLGYVEGGVGVIQGPPNTWDWEGRGIVLAMIHSLSLRIDEVPPGMDRYFGLVVYDEVHHLSAPLFVRTAPLFFGERQGLTATVNREDGLEPIYQYHVGDVYHRDLMQRTKPRFFVQECPVHANFNDDEVRNHVYDKRGKLNIPKLRTYLGTLPECNEFIVGKLNDLLEAGRKILVLSHSKEQLQILNSMFDNSGLCTGNERPASRIQTLREKQLTFGTLQLVKEALDEPTLDTLYILTPFGSRYVEDGGFGTLQQGMGRVQRELEGKKTPMVIFLDHIYIPKFHQMISHLKRMIRKWPEDQGGPYDYKILRP